MREDEGQRNARSAVLERGPNGLGLRSTSGTFVTAATQRLAEAALPGRDLLARAALTRQAGGPPALVDATAGLGADGFHLAALGHEVVMLEREPLLHAILEDGLLRARSGELGPAAAHAAERVTLHLTDARAYLSARPGGTAVVYLDPMFPGKGGSALTNKALGALRLHVPPDEAVARAEEAELLAAARRHATRRVVVKRPTRAPALGGVAPSGSLTGRTVRYDLYAPATPADAWRGDDAAGDEGPHQAEEPT